jgi:hypothetical protein
VALQGTAPDTEIAARLGRTVWAAKTKRQMLGIRRPTPTRRTEEELALLESLPAEVVAKRTGRSVRAVWRKMRAHGLTPRRADEKRKPDEIQLLGTAPDTEISERVGRSRRAVAHKRLRLGTALYRSGGPRSDGS